MNVHKFGGTSLATAACYQRVSDIIGGKPCVVVVSAMAGVTDTLQLLLDNAMSNAPYLGILDTLKQQHQEVIDTLFSVGVESLTLDGDCQVIEAILKSICLVRHYSPEQQASVLGYGEQWSAKLLSQLLGDNAGYINAFDILVTKTRQGINGLHWEQCLDNLTDFFAQQKQQQWIATGFIARTESGAPTTLGRNGSDFSAAIFARLVKAEKLTIWTDVDGIFTADPRRVHSAKRIDELSYKEALELAYFGSSVIHPQALYPVLEQVIPIAIKNTFNPQGKGSAIVASPTCTAHDIRGLSSIDDVALITLEGCGMIGVSGIAARVFDALRQARVSVLLISQASSEHSICFVVSHNEAKCAKAAMQEAFEFELQQGMLDKVECDINCAIVVAVGDSMIGRKGVAGQFLTHLSRGGVNVLAISQGSSERNISVVLKRELVNKALRVAHSGFYLSPRRISVGIIGPGNVGQALLAQLAKEQLALLDNKQINFIIRGIANSKTMLLTQQSIDLADWEAALSRCDKAMNMDDFIAHIKSDDIPHSVIVDCTASQQVSDQYIKFIEQGVHIVTPNKYAVSGPLEVYHALFDACHYYRRHFLYETNVCAGLPIIKTLQDLVVTGDEITCIEGVVSGTLSYVFNELSQGKRFSEVIKNAYELGYTEPDPRDDLSGLDVAKKCVCLAREMGLNISLSDVEMKPLLPDELNRLSLGEFMHALPSLDQHFLDKVNCAKKNDAKLAYIGKIYPNGRVSIDISEVNNQSPFFNLKGTDNMLVFHSLRYSDYPLVVQGPGAGREVTAAGIFSDLLRLVALIAE